MQKIKTNYNPTLIMREKYIKRTYRISKDHDTKVKNSAKKKKKSESEIVRTLIEKEV